MRPNLTSSADLQAKVGTSFPYTFSLLCPVGKVWACSMTGSPVVTVLLASALAVTWPGTFFFSPWPGWRLPLSMSVLQCHSLSFQGTHLTEGELPRFPL